jgi:hypothetical protein
MLSKGTGSFKSRAKHLPPSTLFDSLPKHVEVIRGLVSPKLWYTLEYELHTQEYELYTLEYQIKVIFEVHHTVSAGSSTYAHSHFSCHDFLPGEVAVTSSCHNFLPDEECW